MYYHLVFHIPLRQCFLAFSDCSNPYSQALAFRHPLVYPIRVYVLRFQGSLTTNVVCFINLGCAAVHCSAFLYIIHLQRKASSLVACFISFVLRNVFFIFTFLNISLLFYYHISYTANCLMPQSSLDQ